MATVTITVAAGGNAGATFRALAHAIVKASMNVPDVNSSGASVVLTIDNGPATGAASAQITAGPAEVQSARFIVG